MKKSYKLYLLIFFVGITFLKSYSATYYSRAVGPANWGTAATWSTVGFGGLASTTTPTNADDVIIWTGSTVTMNVAGAQCKSLTINGTASWWYRYERCLSTV